MAPGSSDAINVSPIRKASAPASSRASMSARSRMPLSTTKMRSSGMSFARRMDVCNVDVECFQVSIVHADDFGTGVKRLAKFGFVVDFDKSIEPDIFRERNEGPKFVGAQHRDDQENGAGLRVPRFIDLIRIKDEVLTQHRKGRPVPNLTDPSEVALKEVFFRDDRYGGSSCERIGVYQVSDREIRREDSLWKGMPS